MAKLFTEELIRNYKKKIETTCQEAKEKVSSNIEMDILPRK